MSGGMVAVRQHASTGQIGTTVKYLHVMEDGTAEVEELAVARVHDVERSPPVVPHKPA